MLCLEVVSVVLHSPVAICYSPSPLDAVLLYARYRSTATPAEEGASDDCVALMAHDAHAALGALANVAPSPPTGYEL